MICAVYYPNVYLAQTKTSAQENFIKVERSEREIRSAVCAQRIPERDGSKYCICVLSLKTPRC